MHEIFIGRVSDYHWRYQAGEDNSQVLIGLLLRWLFNPVRSDDADYVQAVKDGTNALVSDKQAGGGLSRSIRRFFIGRVLRSA